MFYTLMQQSHSSTLATSWTNYWNIISYRRLFIGGITLLIGTLVAMPHFFQAIEKRSGTLLDDWVLAAIPTQDVSIPIFLFIWGTTLLLLIRAVQHPVICITFLWSYLMVTLSRMVSISLIPLDAPTGLIPLVDPISNYICHKRSFLFGACFDSVFDVFMLY